MKSRYVQFDGPNVVSVQTEEITTDGLGPWEVVIANEASLVSAGTEGAVLQGNEVGETAFPRRTGYASIGRLLAVGAAVKDFKVGDRVFFAGKHQEFQRFVHGQDHQWGRLYPVPDAISSVDAAFVCLAEIAMVAPALSTIDINDTVAVFGLGVIGNLCAQIYKNMGCRVIGLDPVVRRCELAQRVGIDVVSSVPADQQIAAVKALTQGEGARICVDAAGHPSVVCTAVAATARFGQVLMLGAPRAKLVGDINETFHDMFMRGIVLRGCHMWQLPAFDLRGAKKTVAWGYRNMFDWMCSGKIQVAPLRSHTAKLTDAPEIYRGLLRDRDEYWGVVFEY